MVKCESGVGWEAQSVRGRILRYKRAGVGT